MTTKTSNTKRRPARRLHVGKIVTQVVMTVFAVLFMFPLLIILNYSFKTRRELYVSSPLSLPSSLQFGNYESAFDKLDLAITFSNTLFYTTVSVLILALLCGMTAWAIARGRSRFFKFSYIYFIIGILIPAQALFLPIYIIGYRLNLVNTRFGIIFMYIATSVSFGVFLMNSFMSTVPIELEDAARIDGCSVFKTYFLVVMPLLKPAMVTLIIMQAFQIWNDYLLANLYISRRALRTLTLVIRSLFSAQTSDYTTAMAAIVVSALPITVLFMSLQKYFIKGMTVGAVKG